MPSDRTRIVREGNTIILIIGPTTPQDEGEYILNVENDLGEVTCRTTLTTAGKHNMNFFIHTQKSYFYGRSGSEVIKSFFHAHLS